MIVIIDNYDSFVFNIARYFQNLGEATEVIRNDAVSVRDVDGLKPRAIVISPGPCTPVEAGISTAVVRELSGRLPILGICLGHQCIGSAFGGRVARARRPMHGRSSHVTHDGGGLFKKLTSPLCVGRYHSLVVELDESYAPHLTVTARSEEGEIMALAHRYQP
ncbi:anthranilate synthase component II, partial [Bradyrhizobium brasilense]